MRRHIEAGGSVSAGPDNIGLSGPAHLPIRFHAADETADDRTRTVEINDARVLLMRRVRGVRMRLNLPLAAYLGVAVKLVPDSSEAGCHIAVVLEHRDAALSVPLQISHDETEIVAEWQRWGKLLRHKLLIRDSAGNLREPAAKNPDVSWPRRPRRSALRNRRPKIFKRRARTLRYCDAIVHRGEREIIARN